MVLVWGSEYSNSIDSNLIYELVVLRVHSAGKERALSSGCCTEVMVVRSVSRMGVKGQVHLVFVSFLSLFLMQDLCT